MNCLWSQNLAVNVRLASGSLILKHQHDTATLTVEEARVWRELADPVSCAELASNTQIDARDVAKLLAKLADAGVIREEEGP